MDRDSAIAEVLATLTAHVQRSGPTSGAELGRIFRARDPKVTLEFLQAPSLTSLLLRSDCLAIVDRVGRDLVWGIAQDDDQPAYPLPMEELVGAEGAARLDPREVRLEQIEFCGYRSIRRANLAVSPLTLLVGANGAGKSNVLDGVFRSLRLAEQPPGAVFRGLNAVDRIRTRGYDGAIKCTVRGTGGYSLSWRVTPDGALEAAAAAGSHSLDPVGSLREHIVRLAFSPVRLLQLEADQVAEPAYSSSRVPFVDHRGHHVPAVLAAIAATDPGRFAAIQDSVRQVVPRVEALRMPRTPVFRSETEVHVFDGQPMERQVRREWVGNALEAKVAGHWLPADQLSEGTLLVIALHTILGGEQAPRVLLLDDLDRALHPKAQRMLIRQLRTATATPALTVIASTHSPFVLDELEVADVRVVRLDESGHTVLQPLSDAPEWKAWEGAMSAGEFWVHAGEDWLEAG